jgi:hypothetical protein
MVKRQWGFRAFSSRGEKLGHVHTDAVQFLPVTEKAPK